MKILIIAILQSCIIRAMFCKVIAHLALIDMVGHIGMHDVSIGEGTV